MTALIIKEGTYIGFEEGKGYLYKLNGSLYIYKAGEMIKI